MNARFPRKQKNMLAPYITGFILSIALTLAPYTLVVYHILSGEILKASIIMLGVAQIAVQLIFFLHLGKGGHRAWNIAAGAFAALIVGIVVIGSLWIMANLNTNMVPHPGADIDNTMIMSEGMNAMPEGGR